MKTKEIRSMSEEEIQHKLTEFQDKLFKQRIQKSIGQMDDPYKLRNTRRDIARLITILDEKRPHNGNKGTEKKG